MVLLVVLPVTLPPAFLVTLAFTSATATATPAAASATSATASTLAPTAASPPAASTSPSMSVFTPVMIVVFVVIVFFVVFVVRCADAREAQEGGRRRPRGRQESSARLLSVVFLSCHGMPLLWSVLTNNKLVNKNF